MKVYYCGLQSNQQIKKIEAEYEQVFKDLIDDFKKAGAKASTVEEVKTTPTRITGNTPWDNIPADLQVVLQKEFDKYAAANYPKANATELALIRQNWLHSQSVTIDAYNNAQVGTQNVEPELIAKIPKLSSISNKLLDGRSLDQLSMRDLRKVVDRLNDLKVEKSKTKNTKNTKDINYIKSDINALTRYIAYVRNTKKPANKVESVVELLNNALLARQDEIDVLFTDGTTAREAKSLEDLLSKTKKGYKFDNGKVPQRVTELVEKIELDEKNKLPYVPPIAYDVATYYDTIAFDTSIKDDKKVEEFLKGLKERIVNSSFKHLTLKKFEKIKAAVEKEFTREVVFDTVRDLAHIGASDAGSTIDSLIRDYFNTNKKPIRPAEMDSIAFEQLFGDNGILTLIMDDVIDGTYTVYANNLNVFDKELGENGLAGEMDLLVVDNEGNISIIDVKTSTKNTWKNFNSEDPGKFSKKYGYRVQQTIYRNLLFNMIGKKATIKLLPIELYYTSDGYIKTAKLANITDEGKSTVQLIPVDEVDKYVPLKDIKEITDELSKEERAAIQKEIDILENALVVEKVMEDQEKADEIIKQIEKLQAILKGYQETPVEAVKIESTDKIIFGHPTIGKSYLKKDKDGDNRFITLDDDYKDEVNTFIDANRGSETRQEYKGRKPEEYNKFMLDLFDRLKVQAQEEGKILFVSNTNILKERMNEFDKVITMPKDEFKNRFDARGSTYGFEDWKSDIDATIAKVPANKVINTTGYLSDLLGTKTTETKTKISIADAKKIIKPTTGLGDLLIEVDEEGDLVVPQYDILVQPMRSARKINDLMVAYADAMIAITQGNIPDVLENGVVSATKMDKLVNALELVFNEKQVALGTRVTDKNLSKDDHVIAKTAIFDSIKGDIFVVQSVKGNNVKIKSLNTSKVYTATSDDLKNNFKKHNKMAYEIKEEVAITEEDSAAVVETKNNLDELKKDTTIFNKAKENSKSMSKSERLSKLKNNSNNCI